MLFLVGFAFLAGVVTVLSPCILPLLPIILSATDASGKQKPLGVVVGFIASFTFFTLFLSSIVRASGVSADALRTVSIVVLAVFGASLVVPKVQAVLEQAFSVLANRMPATQKHAGFLGGLLIGMSLGLLWTPCVGPILAAVISLALTGTVTTQAFFITLAYATGTALPMFAILIAGSKALQSVPWLVRNTGKIQKSFGVLMVATAIALYLGVDRQFQTLILKTFPNYGVGLTRFEDNEKVKDQLQKINQTDVDAPSLAEALKKAVTKQTVAAPEIQAGGEWFNSEALSIAELKGKVILVDFWTYSCINCIRTLPYLQKWWEAYKDSGLVIIGVHSPEFEFEKNKANVAKAISDFGITYPVVQDNEFATWKAYRNQYWPAKYLIDAQGTIRYTHFGEGKYDETEQAIQALLTETNDTSLFEPVENTDYTIYSRTPELYLGSARIEHFASPEKVNLGTDSSYSLPAELEHNKFAYEGTWNVMPEYAAPKKGSKLVLNFEAKEVFLVLRPEQLGTVGVVKVLLDGKEEYLGADVIGGVVIVDGDRLYKLILLENPGKHQLELEFLDDAVEAYAFTFG